MTGRLKSIVCMESVLEGNVTLGQGNIIHPKASIVADSGPIVIGESNIFEEQSVVKNGQFKKEGEKLIIGSNNVFEVGATVLASSVGDNNIFESKCYVGPEVEVGNGCVIGAAVTLTVEEKLPDNVVIFGADCNRRIAPERPAAQTLQMDFLSKVLPNYHFVKKKL